MPTDAQRRRDYERSRAAQQKLLNPAPNRSPADRERILVALERIASALMAEIELTGAKPQKGWLPYRDVISTRDEELQGIRASIISDGFTLHPNFDYYIQSMHNPKIKATNGINAVCTFGDRADNKYFVIRRIQSPLPCSEWGKLPLTRAMWNRCATAMILQHALWSWLPAMEHMTDRPWHIVQLHGWYLTETARFLSRDQMLATGWILNEDEESKQAAVNGWTGHNIFKHITDGFSLDASEGSA